MPPICSDCSKTVRLNVSNRLDKWRAETKPATPAPITATLVLLLGILASNYFSLQKAIACWFSRPQDFIILITHNNPNKLSHLELNYPIKKTKKTMKYWRACIYETSSRLMVKRNISSLLLSSIWSFFCNLCFKSFSIRICIIFALYFILHIFVVTEVLGQWKTKSTGIFVINWIFIIST